MQITSSCVPRTPHFPLLLTNISQKLLRGVRSKPVDPQNTFCVGVHGTSSDGSKPVRARMVLVFVYKRHTTQHHCES